MHKVKEIIELAVDVAMLLFLSTTAFVMMYVCFSLFFLTN
jgi:hypothetical protein